VSEAGQDEQPQPDELRDQVEQTREELGETVAQLAAKADVKQRAYSKAAETRVQAQQTAAKIAADVRERTPQPVQSAVAQVGRTMRGRWSKAAAAAAAGLAGVFAFVRLRRRGD
jgi:chromosome segregation ATPase